MRTEFDKEADVAYVYLKDISENEVKKTLSLNDNINIDLDSEGKVIGIEILDASKNLQKVSLESLREVSS